MSAFEGSSRGQRDDFDDDIVRMDQDENTSRSTATSSRRTTRTTVSSGSRRAPGGSRGGMSNFDRERAEIERQSGRGNRNDDGRQGVTEQNVWDKVIDKNGGYQGMLTFDPFQELLDARKFSETPKEPMSPHQAETKLASPA